MAGGDDADLVGQDGAARGAHAAYAAVLAQDAGDFAVLDDIHAQAVRGARVAPGHRVVPRGAPAALQRRAQHRVARVRGDVDDRAECLDLLGRQPLAVDAVQPVGLDPADALAHVGQVVREVEHAALAEHQVDVELLVQALPQLERVLVQRAAFVPEIVGADDRGVAAGVAAPDPALLEDGDVRHPVVLRQVVRGGEPVPAAADDDRVVPRLGCRVAPEWLPALMVGQGVGQKAE